MTYSNSWLLEQLTAQNTFEFLYFWGHRARQDGAIAKTCLSQWWPQGFTDNDVHYPTAEHWMMVNKALTFSDEHAAKQILSDPDPRKAKAWGRKVKNYDNDRWAAVKYPIVIEGNVHKFNQNPKLKAFLLSTGSQILVEASPYDKQWGIGMNQQTAEQLHPRDWQGDNLLGWALMEVRDRLQ